MKKIEAILLKPLDGLSIGDRAEFSQADFERLAGQNAVKKAPAKKAATKPQNKAERAPANKSAPVEKKEGSE